MIGINIYAQHLKGKCAILDLELKLSYYFGK